MTKLKNSNVDKTKIGTKLKLWQNPKTWDVTKFIVWKTKKKKLKLWQTQKYKTVTKKNWNCDEAWTMTNVNFLRKRNTLTTNEMFSGQRFAILLMFCFLFTLYLGTLPIPVCKGVSSPQLFIFLFCGKITFFWTLE